MSYGFRTGKTHALPAIIKFEPSIACRLKCFGCLGESTRARIKGTGKSPHLDLDLYRNIIEDHSSTLIEASLYDEGEPMENPDIVEIVKIASSKNVGTVISTHGSFDPNDKTYLRRFLGVADAGLDKIIFAIDGVDHETYGAYRLGGNVYYVIGNLQRLAGYIQDNNLNTIIEWQMIDLHPPEKGRWEDNRDDQKEARKMAEDLDIEFRIMPNRFKKNQDEEYKRKHPCILPYISCSVDYEGNVGGCIAYDSGGLNFGKITRRRSLGDIWNSGEFQEMRRYHYKLDEGRLDPHLRCYSCDRFGG